MGIMKSTTFALGALMASAAIAQPHRQHKHMDKHHKRNEEVVWVTDYDYVTETAKVTTTIWVSEGFVIPTEAASTPTSAAASSQTYAANFFENAQGSQAILDIYFNLCRSHSRVHLRRTTTNLDLRCSRSCCRELHLHRSRR